MKKGFYLVGSIIFTVLIIIIAFQNFGSRFSGFSVLFFEINSNGALIVFGIALIGVLAGLFYYGFLSAALRSNDEEEEEPGGIV